jgi:hypothetical protein
MRGLVYTEEQLHSLRESPLVKKPDGLPSISQWMDVPGDQNTNNNNGTARRARTRDGETAVAGEQRPLINPMGQFGRRPSMRKSEALGMVAAINALFVEPGEETVLGPPKLSFLSARKNAIELKPEGDNHGDRLPREKNDRWTRERDVERPRGKEIINGRRGGREDGEGWTNLKGRKSAGQEDMERFQRPGDRAREKHEGDADGEAAPRRGARERAEPRWSRRDEPKEEGVKPAAQGGWRDREREPNKEPNREREWTRGANGKAEEDPEWMDAKPEKKEAKPHTQEDFQRWREQMRAKDTPDTVEVPTAISAMPPPTLTQALHTPSAEPTQGMLFGNWGRDTSNLPTPETISAKPRPDKKSKFMNMFAKPEEQAPPMTYPAQLPVSPAPGVDGTADQEGFQRILQMLGQVQVATPPAVQANAPPPVNSARQGGGIALDYLQQQSPQEAQTSRAAPRTQAQQNILENILAPRSSMPESRASQQARFNSMSPDNASYDQFRQPRPEPGHPEDQYHHQQVPPRMIVPDANLTALLSGRMRDEAQRDQATKQRERDFLLTLMQQPRPTPPQPPVHNLPRPNQENQNAMFFDQVRQQAQPKPNGRAGPPPGFMEDPRMFNDNEMMARREAERREQELRQHIAMQQQQEAVRAKNARLSMGFPGHDDPNANMQRRGTGGEPRTMTNMGIPSQPLPDMSFMGGRGQPGMLPTPQERTNIAPPPGFGNAMRQPPGLNGANPQQQQMGLGGPNFSAANTPSGHPPGFPQPGNMRGVGFPAGPGGNPMQGPPQGYFPPSGYGAPMPGMRGEDPRMMFDGHQTFGGPAPRPHQGRPGPSGMY